MPSSRMGSVRSWSGSAVVDWNNTARVFKRATKNRWCASIQRPAARPRVRKASLSHNRSAYSNDRGRTWTKYAKNPVLRTCGGRQPRSEGYLARSKQAVGDGIVPRQTTIMPCLVRPTSSSGASFRMCKCRARASVPTFLSCRSTESAKQYEMGVLGRKQSIPARPFRRQDCSRRKRSRCKAIGGRTAMRPKPSRIFRPATAAESKSRGWPAAIIPTCRSISNCHFR